VIACELLRTIYGIRYEHTVSACLLRFVSIFLIFRLRSDQNDVWFIHMINSLLLGVIRTYRLLNPGL